MSALPQKLAYWAEHYRHWQNSGLSQRSYCQQAGLSFSNFNHWRRRARVAVGPTAGSPKPSDLPKLTLIPAQPISTPPNTRTDIGLRSPAGWQVTLPCCDLASLATLLTQLP